MAIGKSRMKAAAVPMIVEIQYAGAPVRSTASDEARQISTGAVDAVRAPGALQRGIDERGPTLARGRDAVRTMKCPALGAPASSGDARLARLNQDHPRLFPSPAYQHAGASGWGTRSKGVALI
jgi:hypothetical protein